MGADKHHWFKFYPSDWRADQALRHCSIAARGLWVECMCLMHEAKPYGHLLVNGKSLTDTQLAVQTGVPQDQITTLLGELDSAGVFSLNGDGVIYSRKMTRFAKRVAEGQKWGRKGGNPALTLNPSLNPSLKPTLDLEARGQILDKPNKEAVDKLVNSSVQTLKNKKPWTREQKKAAWQTKICAEAAQRMSSEKYAVFLTSWAEGEPWACDLAEKMDRELRAGTLKDATGAPPNSVPGAPS